ncbi:hypothetical protein ACLB2K_019904 [Fragaria x ananassa]
MIVTGTIIHANSNALLIASYASIGDTETARKVFDETSHRTLRAWNAMIIAYSRQRCPSEALRLYSRMISEGIRPDSSTFTVALKACAGMLDLEMGEEVWSQAARCSYEGDVFVGCSVLNLFAKCGKMDEAVAVFNKMPRRDVVCCTTMITGFVQSGRPVEAVEVYRRMQDEGMEFDGTSLVDMYAKSGHLELACCVFNKMSYKNAISWGALVSGFAQNGFAAQALEMVVEMQSCGFEPDSASLGRDWSSVWYAVIDMYSKCGSLSYARALFDQLVFRDLISWNAMIASYGIHGRGEEALSLFLQMAETNIEPDHATFASFLSAFSHSGLVEEGLHWFDVMVTKYKISPGEKHYACMVDLLARSGLVEDASELIASMNTKPGLAVWVALLAGCYNHRKLSMGEIAAKKVLEFNLDDMGVYALVSNFYAMATRWEGVASLKKMMKQTGVKKVPGYSVVEVDGELHAFLKEDKSHQCHEDIMLLLNKLYHDMRAMGYVPNSEPLLPNFEEAHSSEQRNFIKSL